MKQCLRCKGIAYSSLLHNSTCAICAGAVCMYCCGQPQSDQTASADHDAAESGGA